MWRLHKKKNREIRKKYCKGSGREGAYEIVKRCMDIVLALIGLCIAGPLILIFGIAIRLESEGCIIYSQERVGKNGSSFMIYKLRSMRKDADKFGPPDWTKKNDPRITRVGSFIRKTRIDEIPQLINIIKGDMSIVGPRPERPYLVEKFNREIPRFEERLRVKCGLTGWAQVNGGYDLSPEEKLREDLYYIENRSLWLDLKIILKTVVVVFTFKGAR